MKLRAAQEALLTGHPELPSVPFLASVVCHHSVLLWVEVFLAEDPCATVLMPHFVMHESTQSRVYRTIGGIVISVISQIVSCWDSASLL